MNRPDHVAATPYFDVYPEDGGDKMECVTREHYDKLREAAESVVRAWMMSKVTPSNEIVELQRVLESGHQHKGNDVR